MSHFKRNIPVISTLPFAIEGNWKRIIFDSIDLRVPSDLMLHELILSSTNNPMWLMNILREYQPPEIEQLESLTDRNKYNVSEQQFAGVINTSMWNEKLYAVVSLRLYELPQESLDLESQTILQGFSDRLVSTIEQELLNPSPVDKIAAEFCTGSPAFLVISVAYLNDWSKAPII